MFDPFLREYIDPPGRILFFVFAGACGTQKNLPDVEETELPHLRTTSSGSYDYTLSPPEGRSRSWSHGNINISQICG